MTDTSIPAEPTPEPTPEPEPVEPTPEPAEPTEPAGASKPVTEHPAHDMVSELLDALRLQGVEHVFRSVFEWLGRHAEDIGTMAEDLKPSAPEKPAETAA